LIPVLKNVAAILLSEETDFGELKSVLDQWKGTMVSHQHLNLEDPKYNDNVYLSEGKAIATRWAAMCLDDLVRTKHFVRATKKAVDSILDKRPGSSVNLMYVGTGPFATLVLPLTEIYTPEQLQFDLIEVNTESFDILKSTFNSFGLNAYVRQMYLTDATQFKVEKNDVDILLVECLQHALAREPQVKIVENLVPQLKEDVILIPEDITLKLVLINTKAQEEFMMNLEPGVKIDFYKTVDTVFSLNKKAILKNDMQYDERTNLFTEEQITTHNRISILTEMHLFKDEKLTYNQSGLTIPWNIADYTADSPVYGVKTQYETGTDPHLEVKLIRAR
jgi:hypothetical protein